jgi:hypothetical protein
VAFPTAAVRIPPVIDAAPADGAVLVRKSRGFNFAPEKFA